jgi:AcrR family transcriptional regulator
MLSEAERQFSKLGYAGTSIRKLADKLGAFPASIYHQFPSKESILNEILLHWLEGSASILSAIAGLNLPPDVALYKLVYEDCRYVASRELGPQRLFMLPEIREKNFPHVSRMWNDCRDTYQALLKKGIASGVFLDVNTRLYAEYLNTLSSMVLICPDPKALESAETLATVAADLALRAVLLRPNRLDVISKKAAAVKVSNEK